MNDFTKEELKFIYNLLNWLSTKDYPVKNKIQSMIDTYCEHEPLHDLSRGECLNCDKILCHECGKEIK